MDGYKFAGWEINDKRHICTVAVESKLKRIEFQNCSLFICFEKKIVCRKTISGETINS